MKVKLVSGDIVRMNYLFFPLFFYGFGLFSFIIKVKILKIDSNVAFGAAYPFDEENVILHIENATNYRQGEIYDFKIKKLIKPSGLKSVSSIISHKHTLEIIASSSASSGQDISFQSALRLSHVFISVLFLGLVNFSFHQIREQKEVESQRKLALDKESREKEKNENELNAIRAKRIAEINDSFKSYLESHAVKLPIIQVRSNYNQDYGFYDVKLILETQVEADNYKLEFKKLCKHWNELGLKEKLKIKLASSFEYKQTVPGVRHKAHQIGSIDQMSCDNL